MRERFSLSVIALRLLIAGAFGGMSYLFVCSALRPNGWSSNAPISEPENFFAIGIAAILFLVIFWRLMRKSWGKEQIDKILEIDDDG
jgi:hypothetical protein